MDIDCAIEMSDVNIVFGDRPSLALPMMDNGDDRSDIQKSCGQILGVHNCSLSVERGEVLVLMGLSGSGKSTLLRGINGLNDVIRGDILVREKSPDGFEHEISVVGANRYNLRILRNSLTSMVFQQFGLLPWRSVLENVALGLELGGMCKVERLERAREKLELVRLLDWEDCLPSELSGGMQQRVGLARAFATEAPILLMDEPYSALDPLIRHHLQDELLVLQRDLRRTIVFVSHDLDEALKLGNRIAVMDGGRIIQCGSCEDIILRPKNDYVRRFVAHLNPLSVLRAGLIMRAVDGGVIPSGVREVDGVLFAGADIYVGVDMRMRKLVELLRDFSDSGGNIYVYDGGLVVGEISVRDVLGALVQ